MSLDDQHDLDIAIVGMAGRFPGAASIEAFWRNLRAGVESIRDLSEEELREAGLAEADLADRRLVRRAAVLEGAALFDAGLFGFTPREAELTDPQFRVFLEDCWSALEDAGYLADGRDQRIGVFAGASGNSYFLNNVAANPRAAEAVGGFQTSLGNDRDYLATQVSYRLDLRGPSVVVQTACSTSLVAVHLACQSLLGRECDVALAGGVSITVPQASGYLHEEGDITSPDGRCRAFDASAAGCVKGNGSGIVVLRRLADALRDGDTIRAVIKGSAVNNDGALKVGFTAPSEEGQAAVITEALAVAGVDPATISYVEAHGTATPLGDPIEIAALSRALGPPEGRPHRCALGSVKTNLGHLDAAAGVAGLIKAVLALEHREIPPSLHFERPNPAIDLEGSALYVNSILRAWPAGEAPRRAGVSSFGIGGTNAQVILEERPEPRRGGGERSAHLVVLSAATEKALAEASSNLAARLGSADAPDLADAAFTCQVGRKRLPWRRAVVARDAREAIAALRGEGRADPPRREERRGAQVAFLFPGQGAQHAGMAAGLHREEPVFREALDRCAAILRPMIGLDVREPILASGERREEADARLRGTALAQPALFAVEYALARLWISWGVRPSAMAGHSIGEYVAACLAGVMTLEHALALVAERGRLMGALPAGAMLAAQIGEAELEDWIRAIPGACLAAVNVRSSCVASGPEEAIARLEKDLLASGIACRRLHTSHAFHSPAMDPALAPFEAAARRARLAPPEIPFLSNVTGTWITPQQAVDPAYWASQLRRPVRFADAIAELASDPARILLEVGPGTTLASLARQQAGTEAPIVASLAHPRAAVEDEVALLEAAGRLWCEGADIDWTAFHAGSGRRRVPLPTYPFQRERFWIDADRGRRAELAQAPASEKNPDVAEWFWIPGWKRSPIRPAPSEITDARKAVDISEHQAGNGSPGEPGWLVLDDGSPLARALAERARSRGARVTTVRPGGSYAARGEGVFEIDPRRREDYEALARDLRAAGALPGRILHLWCSGEGGRSSGAAQDLGLFSLIHLAQTVVQALSPAEVRIAVVASRLFDVAGEEILSPERATLAGFCRVGPQEYPGLSCRLVDVVEADAAESASRIASEIDSPDREAVAAWRGGHRWVPSYTKVRLDPYPSPRSLTLSNDPLIDAHLSSSSSDPGSRLPENVTPPSPSSGIVNPRGCYVLTGGTGPLELALARRLAAEGARGIAFLQCDGESAPAAESLRAGGVDVLCSEAVVTDGAALDAALASARGRFGRLDGIFHTAATTIGGGMIQLKERSAAERILAPRLAPAPILSKHLDGAGLLVLFSSAVSATGVFGQVDYCAASAFLDAFAQARRRSAGPRVVSVDWGMALWDRWQEATGAGAEALVEQLREIQSSIGITVDEGVEALWRILALGEPQVIVSTQDFEEIVEQAASSSVADFIEGVGAAGSSPGREGRAVVAPESATERKVAALWTGLLGVSPIGRTDNFFDLGGNSLLAIQLASQLRRAFEIELTIASLFESADVASLAAAVDRALEERRAAEEVARLLDEIEALSESEVRSELERRMDAGVAE